MAATKTDTALPLPPPLKRGGTIGIVSPGRWPKPDWISKGTSLLEERGYQVVAHAQNYLKNGQLAGSDAARAEAIMDMFADSTIDAILVTRGGTGSLRLLDQLDYKLIRRNPKPFVGFSDITALLQAISKRAGFAAYHGPIMWNFSNTPDSRTLDDMLAVISNKKKNFKIRVSDAECIRPGRAKGKLVGGNMTLLQNLIGTPYDWSGKDAILFIEDVDEILYKIDRMLNHFRLAGKFADVRAVIVGEMVNVPDGESGFMRKGEKPYGRSLKQILLDQLPPDIPICMNFPCGHGQYMTTLPLGAQAQLILNSTNVELSF